MKYLEYSKNLFSKISNLEIERVITQDFSLTTIFGKISSEEYATKLKSSYREEINKLINKYLRPYEKELSYIRQFESISFYEESIAAYTAFFLFWIWENKVNIEDELAVGIIESVFLGTIGYRLIDIHTDAQQLDSEAVFLGTFMIRLHENIIHRSFPELDTISIFEQHTSLYTQVEYLEKRSKGHQCPFSWENAGIIGYKTAPLFAVFETMFRFAGLSSEEVKQRLKGLSLSAAAIQMMDDISDAEEDLGNGFESLVMKGILEQFKPNPTKEHIKKFLTPSRLRLFYNTTQKLFSEARQHFEICNDTILMLFLEIQNHRFNSRIEFY